jgi:hypothetical protein
VAHDPARSDPALPDVVERRFEAAGPDELWVADFTYLRSWHGVVFLSFVIDVWSPRVVGWQFHPTCAQASSSTRYAWRSPDAAAALMSSSYTTRTSNASARRHTTSPASARNRLVGTLYSRLRHHTPRRNGRLADALAAAA